MPPARAETSLQPCATAGSGQSRGGCRRVPIGQTSRVRSRARAGSPHKALFNCRSVWTVQYPASVADISGGGGPERCRPTRGPNHEGVLSWLGMQIGEFEVLLSCLCCSAKVGLQARCSSMRLLTASAFNLVLLGLKAALFQGSLRRARDRSSSNTSGRSNTANCSARFSSAARPEFSSC
jgi:hypothetical protein